MSLLEQIKSDAANVETLLIALTSEVSAQRLIAMAQDNTRLRHENQKLTEEITVSSRMVQRLQNEADAAERQLEKKMSDLQGVVQEKEKLDAELATMKNKFRESEKKAADLNANFKRQKEATEGKLKDKTDELQRLEQFSVSLELLEDNDTEIKAAFNTIYSSARRLAEDYFGGALPENILENDGCWDKISEHSLCRVALPLISSNEPLAKHMRVALILSVLGHELCKHIFQPTHMNLLKGSSGLDRFLMILARQAPDHESYLRSVLLKASKIIQTEDEPLEKACIKAVVDTVKNLVSPVILEPRRKAFEADLQNLCKTACEQWRFIQTIDDRVVAELGSKPLSRRKHKWKPFVFAVPASSSAGSSKQRANGTTSTPEQEHITADPAAGVAVWPAFYNLSGDDEETIAEGFILPVFLTRAAEEEQNAVPTPTSPSARSNLHKEQREVERSLNPKKRRSSVATTNGQAGEAKERSSFLSKSSGNGAKGV